jgi:hypothetical protein
VPLRRRGEGKKEIFQKGDETMIQKHCKLLCVLALMVLAAGYVFASPYFAISQDQWQDALDEGKIAPIGPNDFAEIMQTWQYPQEGEPYPATSYRPPELYVYSPYGCVNADPAVRFDVDRNGSIEFTDFAYFALEWLEPSYDYSFLEGPGLVMAWGDYPPGPSESWSSGWQFIYTEDPDLSNVTITASVNPPGNINAVCLGMEDINKKRMMWQWSVPNPLPKGQYTMISINTALSGVSAATPTATGFTVDAGFDITQVQKLFATENSSGSLGTQQVPPPNQNVKKPWNYWKDLIIVPNPVPVQMYYKWRQPAQFINNPGNFWGWDEISIDPNQPLLADDWCCTDDRPITDIHWWGSFPNKEPNQPGWFEPVMPPPPIGPIGFHIGIWTDSPGDPNGQDLTKFSHPDQMIFEQYCYTYDANFVGYDRDPNDANHPVTDACFKFSCDLDPNFVQDPNANNIYWLSIAAIYDGNTPEYIWGWKTRPHYFNDDAVRITSVQSGIWPPTLGDIYQNGNPLECPKYCSWDLAFELTTDVNDANSCPCFRR